MNARSFFLVTSLLYVALFIIVWFLHPEKPDAPVTLNANLKSVFAASTVTILPFAVLVTGLLLNTQFKRERVVKQLARELHKTLEEKRSIDTLALQDLTFLGEHGRAGAHRQCS